MSPAPEDLAVLELDLGAVAALGVQRGAQHVIRDAVLVVQNVVPPEFAKLSLKPRAHLFFFEKLSIVSQLERQRGEFI